jgi:hypothetical protein
VQGWHCPRKRETPGGFHYNHADDVRRQKVDHRDYAAVREDEGQCSGLGADRGSKSLRSEILELHEFTRMRMLATKNHAALDSVLKDLDDLSQT